MFSKMNGLITVIFSTLKLQWDDRFNRSQFLQRFQYVGRNRCIGAEENNIPVAFFFLTHLHSADVYIVLAEGRADFADRTRRVDIVDQGQMAFRDHFQTKCVDSDNSGIAFAENGAGDRTFHPGGDNPDSDQINVVLGFRAGGFCYLDAPFLGDEFGIYVVDVVLYDCSEQPFENGG